MAKETINIGKIMRENAYIIEAGKKQKLRVSPAAVQEMISFLNAGMDNNMTGICKITVGSDHPKTVYEDDIILHFNRIDTDIDAMDGD